MTSDLTFAARAGQAVVLMIVLCLLAALLIELYERHRLRRAQRDAHGMLERFRNSAEG